MSKFNYDGDTFYHGTSHIFLESIRNTGLGAINPNIDCKNLDVLRYLYQRVKNANVNHPEFLIWEDSIRATLAQTDLVIRGQNTTTGMMGCMYLRAT